MRNGSFIARVKPPWKWLVAGIVAIGLVIWGWLKWFGAAATKSTAVKTITTAAVVAGGAATLTFSFGDKAALRGNMKEAFKLVAEGRNTEAAGYVESLLTAADDHLVKASLGEPDPESLRLAREAKRIAELLKLSIPFATNELPQEQWIATYERMLKANAGKSRELAQWLIYLSYLTEDSRAEEKIWALIEREIPTDARAQFADWLAVKRKLRGFVTLAQCVDFYENLLVNTGDSAEAAKFLPSYITTLDQWGRHEFANNALDHFIALFPDTELGAQAAVLRLGGMEAGPVRKAKVLELVEEKYPNSQIAKRLRGAYVQVLIEQERYQEAIMNVDEEKLLDKVTTLNNAAEVLLKLTRKARKMPGTQIPVRFAAKGIAKEASTPASQIPPFDVIGARLARQLLEAGDYATSVELNLAILREADTLPVNFTTGWSIGGSSEIADSNDPDAVKCVAKYFTALVEYHMKQYDIGDRMLEELIHEPMPKALRPYVLFTKAQRAKEKVHFEAAVRYAKEALAEIPHSVTLLELFHELTTTLQMASLREKSSNSNVHTSRLLNLARPLTKRWHITRRALSFILL